MPLFTLEKYEKALFTGTEFAPPAPGNYYVSAKNDLTNTESINRICFAVDNIPESDFTFPRLTTVHVHKELLGELAIERIIRRIENPSEIPLRIITPTSLVIRQSCGSGQELVSPSL